MADRHFSWLTESTLESPPISPQNDEDKKIPQLLQLKEKALHHKRVLIGISVLLGILFVLKLTQKENTVVASRSLEAMAAMLPIPKGQVVEGMLLRPVKIAPGVLSKSQKLQRVLPDDAEKIMGKVRAKKDIPPHRPLLWSDLELIPAAKTATKTLIPVITYPEK